MEVDDLTEEQSDALTRFREVIHIDSVETCRQYLAAHDWDVERAIETALISDSDLPSASHDQERITTDPIPSAPPMPEPFLDEPTPRRRVHSTPATDQQTANPILQILRLPLSFLYAFYLQIEPFIPWGVVRFFVAFIQSLFWSAQPIDSAVEIDDYCAYFDNQYDARHPAFYRGKLSQALLDAQREVRLLFIYLHEKNSPVCDRFCREVLCGDALRVTIGDNLLWSASRDTQEGAQASRLLHVNSFPCLCIVAHHGSQQTVQLKLDRYTDSDEFLAELINGVQHADQMLQYNREQRNTRTTRDRLLEEQNAAYLDAMRADQEKAKQRMQEESERRKQEEDQRRLQEEQQRKLQELVAFRDRIKQSFPNEPDASESDIVQVSIRLPANEPIRRRFRRSDPAKLLFEFAWTNANVPDRFELLWGYPRKRYQYEQMGDQRIADVMTAKTETCYLEQIDEENN